MGTLAAWHRILIFLLFGIPIAIVVLLLRRTTKIVREHYPTYTHGSSGSWS